MAAPVSRFPSASSSGSTPAAAETTASPPTSSASSPSVIAALSPALISALEHHRQGALQKAQQAYEQILAFPKTDVSDAAGAQHWLGVLHLQRKDASQARVCFEHALALAPGNFASQLNLGHARLQLGDHAGAFSAYDAATRAPQVDIAAAAFAALAREHMHRAFSVSAQRHRMEQASDANTAQLSSGESTIDSDLHSEVLTDSDSPAEFVSDAHIEQLAALAALDRAVALQPDMASFHDSRGSVLNVMGNYGLAEQAHRTALALQPAHPGFHNNVGLAVKAQGRLDDAIWHFRDALRRDPDHVPALINLGQAVAMTGDFDQASAPLTRAIAIAPDSAAAHQELGNVFAAMADYGSALTHYSRAVDVDPQAVLAWQNLGAMRFELGEWRGAGEAFEKALRLNPGLALARFNLASIQLGQGDWRHGWAAYEARLAVWRAHPDAPSAAPPGVRWRGAHAPLRKPAGEHFENIAAVSESDSQRHADRDGAAHGIPDKVADHPTTHVAVQQGYFALKDKRILLYSEQGLGDTIQFFRFCVPVAAQAKQVILAVPASLYPLLAPMAAILASNITVLSMTSTAANAYADRHIDCHCPLLSLPLALGIHHPEALSAPSPNALVPTIPPAVPPYVAGSSIERGPPQWTLPPLRRGAKTRLLAGRAVTRIARLTWVRRTKRSRSGTPFAPRVALSAPVQATLPTRPAQAAHVAHPVKYKVGLAWSGKPPGLLGALAVTAPSSTTVTTAMNDVSSDHRTARHYDKRAIPLTALQPLLDLPNIEWHVLQTEISEADIETLTGLMATHSIVWRSQAFENFADTANAIGELDHVVSIDTSVAHLAGAMGWPVSLMLPLAADWRWSNVTPLPDKPDRASTQQKQANTQDVGANGASCYWYPSIRMFKQTHRNDWTPVVRDVVQSLTSRFQLRAKR